MSDAAMLEDALTALADLIEKSGHYEAPMTMEFANAGTRALHGVNESSTDPLLDVMALLRAELAKRDRGDGPSGLHRK